MNKSLIKVMALVIGVSLLSSVTVYASPATVSPVSTKFQDSLSKQKNDVSIKNKALLETLKKDSDFKILYSDDNGAISFTNSPSAINKSNFKSKLESIKANGTDKYYYLTGPSSSTYYSTDHLDTWFNEDLYVYLGNLGEQDTLSMSNGITHSFLYGNSPSYPDTIDQKEVFTVGYTGVSVSLNSSNVGSGTISKSGNTETITWPTLTNCVANHYYSYNHYGVDFQSSAYEIDSYNHKTSATYRIGSNTVSSSTSATVYPYN